MTRLFYLVINRFISIFHTQTIKLFHSRVIIDKKTIVFHRSSIINYSKTGNIIIGKNCKIGCPSKYYHGGMPFYTKIFNEGENSNIVINNNCRINGAYIHAERNITIGDNCVIAAGVHIIDSNGHVINSTDRTKGRDKAKDIVIGENVWIGINSIILKGSHIGNNCVISAGSVVKGSFPDNSLIIGNPAIIAKHLDL